jgi:hypothetical protein
MKTHDPRKDRWFWDRLMWMRDHQPDYLRELSDDPATLVDVVAANLYSAGKVQHDLSQQGHPASVAEELAREVLCPAEVEPDRDALPISDQEWERIKAAVNSARAVI